MSGGGRGGGPPLVGPGGSSASGPSPNMSMMTTTGQGRWYFSAERLHMTPSRRHDISSERELGYRQQAANFIQDMGQRLHVPQLCINTAIVYMQRFYMFHSFKHFHRNTIAVAALFLAAKVEEQPRKLEHVIKVAHICLHRDQAPLDTRSEQYMEQAQELVTNENILLQTLGFDVAIDHPHTHVVRCCQLVKASKDLAQTSYFMATNSLHLTTMCLRHTPTIVACVCIHLACKWTNYKIPLSSRGKEWFLYVDPNTSLELLNKLTDEFLTIFDRCPSRLKKKIMATAQATKEEEERRASNDIPASQYTPDYSRRHETPSSSNASKQHIIPMGKSSSASSQQQSQVRPGHHGTTRNDKPHRSSGPPDNNNKQPSMSHKPMDPARAAAYDEYKKQQQSRLSSQQQQSAHRQMPRPGTHLQPPSGRPPPPSMSSSQKQPQVHSKPPPPLHHPPRQPWIQPPKSGGSSSSKPPEPPRHHHAKQQPPSLPPPPPPQQQRSIPHHPTHKPERKPATAAPLRKSIFDIDDESPPLHSKPEAPPLPNPTSGNGLLNIMLDPTVPLHSIIKSNSPNSSKKEERSPPPPPKQPRTASLFSPPSSSRVRSLSNASGSSSSEEVVSLKLPKVEETPGYEKLRDGVTSIQIPKTSSSSSTSNHHSKEEQQHHLLQEEGVGGSSSSSSRKKHKKEKKSKKEKKEKKDKRDKSSSSSSSSHHHKSRHQEEDIHHHHHRSSESGEGGKHPGIKLKIKPLPPVSSEESSSPHLPKVDPLKISLKPTEATSTANTAASSSKKRLRPSDHHPLSPSFKVARVMNQDLFSSPPDALKKTH